MPSIVCGILLNPALRTRKKGGLFGRPPFLNRSVGVETDRNYERLHRPVGSSCLRRSCGRSSSTPRRPQPSVFPQPPSPGSSRSEEHTSELQSQFHLVCRLLLEKKK